jgi:N-acetylated-alpha-linked acidic dipeptidase
VLGRIPGGDAADEWIVRGNHHDAWVNGAEDPISGLVALLEEARAMGALARQGWKPRRTIVFAAWDGEEQGLLGSTEWAEQHGEELRKHAAVYINTDGNDRGFFGAAGSHTLEQAVNDAARDVTDPETGLSVWKRAQLQQIATGTDSTRREARDRPDLRIGALGSGSDFTPFLQHLGIASLNLGFGGEEPGSDGVYHSIYDSFAWYTRFADTGFTYNRALSQVAGTLVMRLAGADILPFRASGLAETVVGYIGQVKALAATRRDSILERNRQISEGVYTAISDPRQPLVPPAREAEPPFLNFAPLENAGARLRGSALRYEAAYDSLAAGDGASLEKPAARSVSVVMAQLERALLQEDGLPGRPWYRHYVHAPGLYTGYSVKTLPAVREAIEQGSWDAVDTQVTRTTAVLEKAASLIDSAATSLEKARTP